MRQLNAQTLIGFIAQDADAVTMGDLLAELRYWEGNSPEVNELVDAILEEVRVSRGEDEKAVLERIAVRTRELEEQG